MTTIQDTDITATINTNNRLRRLRRSPGLRALVRETRLTAAQLIAPLFVTDDEQAAPITSMPGVSRLPVDAAVAEAQALYELGVGAVLLFGIPAHKDPGGSESYDDGAAVQRAIRGIKQTVPALPVITDVCLCEYTDHGHCGVVNGTLGWHVDALPEGYVLDEPTLPILGRIAVSHAAAGADVIAPSGMLDGAVGAIRMALDEAGFAHLPILSYSAKYASGFYGPFREAAQGAPAFGDRASHQMDPANGREALLNHARDLAEGADALMVKPALAYLDVIKATRERYPDMPLCAYNVSGEYAMVKAAAKAGWLDEKRIVMEILTGIRRAGADMIITYHAADAARWLKDAK